MAPYCTNRIKRMHTVLLKASVLYDINYYLSSIAACILNWKENFFVAIKLRRKRNSWHGMLE